MSSLDQIFARLRINAKVRRFNFSLFWCLLVGPVLLPSLQSAEAQAYKTEIGHIQFTSSVPLHTFSGESEKLVGMINLADSTVDFYVDLSSLETGIGKRDKDMRVSLETKKYPFGEFFGKLVSPFDPQLTTEQQARVRGTFSLHGQTQEIVVSGSIQKSGASILIKAAWDILLDDYNIVPPKLLFVKVDQLQAIHLEALLSPYKGQ